MHTGSLKKWALALTFWLALHTSSLKAQIFTNDLPLQAVTTGTNPVDFEFRADGTLIAKGNYGVGSLVSGDQGVGTRMLWYPALGAFRAGGVDSTFSSTVWNVSNLGIYSVAFGLDNAATGSYAAAFGYANTASGSGSTVSGQYSQANGDWSVAMGYNDIASSPHALAFGALNTASAWYAAALGVFNSATGGGSLALGSSSTASGYCAITLGSGNIAAGVYSTASGNYTTATSYFSFVTGTYNVGGGNESTWVSTDPLFEIGNGTAVTPSDALVVYKNGNAVLQGTLQIAPGGDIPMFTGE